MEAEGPQMMDVESAPVGTASIWVFSREYIRRDLLALEVYLSRSIKNPTSLYTSLNDIIIHLYPL